MAGKGGIRAGKKKEGITISMYSVWGAQGGLCNTEKTSSDSTASYYADNSDCERVCAGDLVKGGNLVNIMFFL